MNILDPDILGWSWSGWFVCSGLLVAEHTPHAILGIRPSLISWLGYSHGLAGRFTWSWCCLVDWSWLVWSCVCWLSSRSTIITMDPVHLLVDCLALHSSGWCGREVLSPGPCEWQVCVQQCPPRVCVCVPVKPTRGYYVTTRGCAIELRSMSLPRSHILL